MLIHTFSGAVDFHNAAFGEGTGVIVLDRVSCHGTEASLASCVYYYPSSSDYHSEDAGIQCQPCKLDKHNYKVCFHCS